MVQDVRYAAAAGAVLMMSLAYSLDGHTFRRILGAIVVAGTLVLLLQNAGVVFTDTRATAAAVSRDTNDKYELRADMYHIRRKSVSLAMTSSVFPDIANHVYTIAHDYGRSHKGTVRVIASDTEHFFQSYHDLLMQPRRQDDVTIRQRYDQLLDLRSNVINSMITLLYAKPHAHTKRRELLCVIDAFRRRSLRSLKILHNKFGQRGLQAETPTAPRHYDPLKTHDSFSVHI